MEDELELTDFEEEVFEYLDDLRESGVINMFGVGQHIRESFGVDRKEASELLSKWMSTFGQRHP